MHIEILKTVFFGLIQLLYKDTLYMFSEFYAGFLISKPIVIFQMHVVSYNMKYNNLSFAADKSDGLAVLGFWFSVSASW